MNKIRRSMFRVSWRVFRTYFFAAWEKLPITMLPTTILLLRRTSTGWSSSASQRIWIRFEIRPDWHIMWVLLMIKAEEMKRSIRSTVSTISRLEAWCSAM